MNIGTILIIQIVVLAICVGVKSVTKRKLDDIDGYRGLSTTQEIESARQHSL